MVGLVVLGMGAGIVAIPVVPEMIESVDEVGNAGNRPRIPKEAGPMIENMISGIYICFTNLGEAVGPTVSAFMVHHFDFQTAQESYALFIVSFAALYFLCCGHFTMFAPEKAQTTKTKNWRPPGANE